MQRQIRILYNCFQSRLSRKIVLAVFASIVVIEIIIFIPSYVRREDELLMQLEDVSGAIINSIARLTQREMSATDLPDKVNKLTENTLIQGVIIFDKKGKVISQVGETPDLDVANFKSVDKPQNIQRKFSSDQNYYDIGWPAEYLGSDYSLITRLNAQSVKQELWQFKLRISILVLIISAFVTFITMLVLGKLLISPILRLRDDLQAVGESLNHDQSQLNFYACSTVRNDELGEVLSAFKEMYNRIYTEISQRKIAENFLRQEQQKSEDLLLNILPQAIAEKLKNGEKNIANNFSDVTILFADLVGFTNLSVNISPCELVNLLNQIFSAFDNLTDRYHLEKIKTIGDSYMVVGGLPAPQINHAANIADMALDMLKEIEIFNEKNNLNLSIRIGINTGPVVAGVIGEKKFIYDLWGDAVNTASRMEYHGIPNTIQMSETTYRILHGNYRNIYQFRERGEIYIKGKGIMKTFFLINKNN
jgi:class 3 adenylate cyclase